ncbi:diol dehydratase small subunit [Desulfosoma sp.]
MSSKDTIVSPDLIAEAVKRVMAALSESAITIPGGSPGKTSSPIPSAGKLDHRRDYPLSFKRPELVRSAGGLGLDEITLAKVVSKEIHFEDIKIRPDTLEYQAQIAESAGRPRLAANLRRAAELTRISDERILEIYNALRPYRSTKQELLEIARELESKYQAHICAALVREAADVYEQRNRLRKN